MILRNAIWSSEGRSSFHAYVLREVLKYCENKPEIVVDRGFWYKWALKRLGLRYRHETFGERNPKDFFQGLKKEQRDSGTGFRSGVLLNPFKVGWIVLWHSIIIGGVYLDSLS